MRTAASAAIGALILTASSAPAIAAGFWDVSSAATPAAVGRWSDARGRCGCYYHPPRRHVHYIHRRYETQTYVREDYDREDWDREDWRAPPARREEGLLLPADLFEGGGGVGPYGDFGEEGGGGGGFVETGAAAGASAFASASASASARISFAIRYHNMQRHTPPSHSMSHGCGCK